MSRASRATVACLVALLLFSAGCLADFGESRPPPPESPREFSLTCCDGYDRGRLARLVGGPATDTAHDEIDFGEGQFRVRAEAYAVGRRIDPAAFKDRPHLSDKVDRLPRLAADEELLAVLLRVTPVAPSSAGTGLYSASVAIIAPGTRELRDKALLIGQRHAPVGPSTVVLVAVVSKGAPLVACGVDAANRPDRPWLDLRSGRLVTEPASIRRCGQPATPGPSPS